MAKKITPALRKKYREHMLELYDGTIAKTRIVVYCREQEALVESGVRDSRLGDDAIMLLDGLA